ncbi:MAG TPA: hypothetical protein VIU61_08590 [Kofleriaceae bacterium]
MTDDPYRSAHSLRCPRCEAALIVGDGSFLCSSDCGEWLPIEALQSLGLDTRLGTASPPPPWISSPPCVVCRRDMEGRTWIVAHLERCLAHGFWIDATHRTEFHKQVTAMMAEEREIQKLADRLAYPEGRREIAVRLRALERRVELLERKG